MNVIRRELSAFGKCFLCISNPLKLNKISLNVFLFEFCEDFGKAKSKY